MFDLKNTSEVVIDQYDCHTRLLVKQHGTLFVATNYGALCFFFVSLIVDV